MISHLLQIYDSAVIYSMGKFTKGNNSTSMWLHRILYHFFIENVSFSPDFSLACYPCFWELHSSAAGGNGSPLQGSCLVDPGDGGAWRAAVSGVAQSRTRLCGSRSSAVTKRETGISCLEGNVLNLSCYVLNSLNPNNFTMIASQKFTTLLSHRLFSLNRYKIGYKKRNFLILYIYKDQVRCHLCSYRS